jgi:uncharacterized protein involved in exopolysaccharide biosynthesis
VLAWFGAHVIGDQPQLLDDPGQMIAVLKSRAWWFVGLVALLCVLYVAVMRLTAKPAPSNR